MTDILGKLRAPAIGLLVCGVLNGSFGALILLSGLMRFSGILPNEKLPTQDAERIGYLMGTFGGYGVGFLSLAAAPIIVFAAIRMMKGENRGFAILGAILAILPITSCCFFVGAIFGIWSVIVLMNAEVKQFFLLGGENGNINPPQPPRAW